MDDVGLLVRALIRDNPYDLLVENQKYLEFANTILDDGDHKTKALEALLICSSYLGRCPESIESLLFFIQKNEHHISSFEKSVAYEDELKDLAAEDEDSSVDTHTLIDTVYYKAYNKRVGSIYAMAGKIAIGAQKHPKTEERGPEAANEFMLEEMETVITKSEVDIGGDLVENIDLVESYIESFIVGDSRRLYTGFKKIDGKTLIGKKQRIRWIGILGYTHHGKSLFLMSMLYNMAIMGANILLVPRESSVEDAWMNIVWLHHKRICPDRPIAPREDWMREGSQVGSEKYQTIKMIIDDLRSGKTLKGKIVVHSCGSWDDVEEKLKSTDKDFDYDVCAVDYFGHLDTEGGSKRESDTERQKKNFRRAQKMTLSGIHNDQKGLVIITPLQANKEGYKEAKKDGESYGIYESLTAVEWYTQAAQDMDCVMSVWFEGDSCKEVSPKQMIVHCLKGRGNMRFPTHRVMIDDATGYISDIEPSSSNALGNMEQTLDDIPSMDDVVYTTTNLDMDDWGL